MRENGWTEYAVISMVTLRNPFCLDSSKVKKKNVGWGVDMRNIDAKENSDSARTVLTVTGPLLSHV